MKRSFVFPGQGSQAVGMGRALAEAFSAAREVFQEIDDALSQKLFALMTEGPEDALTLTRNAQPALMAASLAAVRVIETEAGQPLEAMASFVAGHSLGEYSALAAARSLGIGETARLLRVRGEAMQAAVPVGKGGMAALLGLDLATVDAVVAEAAGSDVLAVANDNSEGQVVVSGDLAAVERAVTSAKGKGAKRALLLPVSAPFHCPLMAPAADVMAEALAETEIKKPVVPVITNISVQPETEPDNLRRLLVEQVTGRVRWRECVLRMAAEETALQVELGAGKVLTGLVRRIDKSLKAVSVQAPADVDAFLKNL